MKIIKIIKSLVMIQVSCLGKTETFLILALLKHYIDLL